MLFFAQLLDLMASISSQYNFVVQEWMRLQHEVRLLRLPPTPQPEPATPDMDIELDMAKTPQPRPMAELDQTKLRSAAVQDPESYLISPLPQFTGRLPDAAVLPDEDEPRDQSKPKGAATKSPRRQDSSLSFQSFVLPPTPQTPSLKDCGAAGHPWTCNCQEFVIFNEGAGKPGSRRPSFTNPLPTPVSETQPQAPPPTPSGVSHSTPMSPGRLRSYTIPTHNSRPPSRAPSPKPRPTSGPRNVYSPSSGHSSLQGKETESLKSRLHDLLQDNAGVSSSLPNMPSSHFPASFARETPQSTQKAELPSRPPSRSGATPLQHRVNPLSPKQSDSERPKVSPPTTTSSMTPPTPPAPSVPSAPAFSRASNAAMVLEKERKEKKEQERERRRLEKEKTRAAEQETLNRSGSISNSSATGSAGVSASYGRSRASPGRESTGPYGSQRHTNTGSSHGSGSIAPSASPSIFT
ncbi:hypothetical protein P691DRAFT_125562 [Macrolepiota fuliginosa MF-IS2]|uniref:Uncharacterized protein n=1 Tax=Macrolepiota fuliginosa MF-IS2 TaxID=1400762 RepID=A0A9P5X9K7_9AGAR|nr:hypothetical protein P691DRAFT_125562 [Macrolepiota fuliginosa MF-IS2]